MTPLSFALRQGLRAVLPSPVQARARRAERRLAALSARLRLPLGVRPVSPVSGWDRGTAMNRYYLAHFLHTVAADIAGECLEFQADLYTSRFGGDKVVRVDILHKEAGNPQATLVADLTAPNALPSQAYDCIVCTYVLHVIAEVHTAVAELYRLLKPGGVLLVAVPHLARHSAADHELWRFTPAGLQRLLARVFGAEQVVVRAYGNSLTAAGFIRGLAAEDFTAAELDRHHDPAYAVGLFARACKLPPAP
jgi:SAM-dependent methyltransferase